MSETQNLDEVIEHLARHEGGAIGCAPVIIATADEEIAAGGSVDQVLAKLRDLAERRPDDATRAIAITRHGRNLRLDKVLGYHMPTGRVVVEGTDVTP